MTDIISALKKIELMEGKLSELYAWFSKVFEDNREFASFFFKLSLDEKQHRDLVTFQLKLARNNRGLFGNTVVSVDHIESFIKKLDDFRTTNPDRPQAEAVFPFVLQIENSLCEQYYSSVMEQSNEDVAELVKTLSKECDNHYRECLEMAKKHKFVG